MLIIKAVPLAITKGLDAGVIVSPRSTPRVNHDRKQLIGQQALQQNEGNSFTVKWQLCQCVKARLRVTILHLFALVVNQAGDLSWYPFENQNQCLATLPLASTPFLCCYYCPDRCLHLHNRQWRSHCSSGHCGNCLHSLLHCLYSSLSEVTSRGKTIIYNYTNTYIILYNIYNIYSF